MKWKWEWKTILDFLERFRNKRKEPDSWMTPERIALLHQNFAAFKAGDKEAYAEIYSIFFTPLYKFCIDLKPDVDAVRQALYAAFEGMMENCARFRDPEHLEYYLYVMARYKILGALINERIPLDKHERRAMKFHLN